MSSSSARRGRFRILPRADDPHFGSLTAFTLIELLVLFAIIGLLIALLIPAVQVARESSRRTACGNNLHQLALAIKLHEGAQHAYPTGGWGADWVGDPDSGFNIRQPGGWPYNILPYIEQSQLRELGRGQSGVAKRAAIAQLLQSPIPTFNCPSRRAPAVYPYHGSNPLQNVDPPISVAKSDYATNGEISYLKSEVLASVIQRKRGLSKTVLLGEKCVPQQHYENGQGTGDMLPMYVGDSDDIRRAVTVTPVSDADSGAGFGCAHSSGCNVAMCDASVRLVHTSDPLQP